MKRVEICLQFLEAERNGDWQLQLDMSCIMLPYFAASGHYHYQTSVHFYFQTMSVHFYFQTMSQIHMTHPGLHKHFMNGLHVIRRSDCFRAGFSPDLVIEQVLMQISLSGDLSTGHGMSERQQAIWLLLIPVKKEVNRAMQDFMEQSTKQVINIKILQKIT